MMKKGEIVGLSIALVAGLISLFYDTEISQSVASLRAFVPDWFFVGFTFEIQTIIILFFLTSLFLFQERKRKWILPLWFTAFFSVVISYILKIIFLRPRPFETGAVSVFAIAYQSLGNSFSTWNSSFPSFQAVLAFSALPLLDKEFKRFKWVWLIIACLIAASRVYFGLHYLSDVLFGGIIGYLIGYFFVRLEKKYLYGEKTIKIVKKIIKG